MAVVKGGPFDIFLGGWGIQSIVFGFLFIISLIYICKKLKESSGPQARGMDESLLIGDSRVGGKLNKKTARKRGKSKSKNKKKYH